MFNPPKSPGVYIYKDKDGKIIYIGKAKNLKNRVNSYFVKNQPNEKTKKLVTNIKDADFIVTNNEMEALILESNLIRMHKPKYNIDLKNNIRHAYIQITKEEYPKLLIARKKNKKDLFFGPIPIGQGRNEIVRIIRRIFRIRNCNVLPKKVCLQHHLGQCSAPCEQLITKSEYVSDVNAAVKFLKGDKSSVVEQFEKQMLKYAEQQNFETAKLYRDRIRSLQNVSLDQVVDIKKQYDSDFINFITTKDKIFIVVIRIKKGIIIKKDNYEFDLIPGIFENFLSDYYSKNEIPGGIYLPKEAEDFEINLSNYEEVFSKKAKQKVEILVPKRGEKLKIINLAKQNAELNIRNKNKILLELQKHLKLEEYPMIIDCFDISTIQGTNNVGACVRFVDGKPFKSAYRKFIIKSLGENEQNDFQAMKEVIGRRYARLKNEQSQLDLLDGKKRNEHEMPNLIIIDGGRQQLNMAVRALNQLRIKLPIISLAKREEEIYFPGGGPLQFSQKTDFMKLVTRIRDEVHSFVIRFHRSRRDKKITKSVLNEIEGVGTTTAVKLLNEFGSISQIKNKSIDQINQILKNKSLSKKIFDYFNN